MKACVFVGPTLRRQEAHAALDAHFLPPARLGDVYQAVSLLRPRVIGIVDGYFQWAPAVWHKEILWALDGGIQVFGAASIGALRAAELHPFGMQGVGTIFQAYRDAALRGDDGTPFEDDDEVAVVHGPAELGYPPLSDAMVNIRLTIQRAVSEGVVAPSIGDQLRQLAKATFFAERSYAGLLRLARQRGLPVAKLGALERWLPDGAIDQKRADALDMLRAMRASRATWQRPPAVNFRFESNCYWQAVVHHFEPELAVDETDERVLAELRLDPAAWQDAKRAALDRLLPAPPSASAEPSMAAAQQSRAWATARDRLPPAVIDRAMLSHLQAIGKRENLRRRGDAKHRYLGAMPKPFGAVRLGDMQRLALTDWYFAQVLGGEMPDDLPQWARDAGHRDEEAFIAALFDEYRFRQAVDAEPDVAAAGPGGASP